MSETVAAERVVYESTITAVGEQVEAFLGHGLLIFFADESPAELHDMSVRHVATVAEEGPRTGDTIVLGEHSLEVLAVGPVVGENLLNLGHIDIKANGLTEAKLPGDANVPKQTLPMPSPGDAFRIIRGSGQPTEG
ncbi:MAG TPA: PTS glucitol/sorbitol transporter subunit IIA [Nocardioidaceae bacterium]|nr:PTS glucitol/sorbitol transporter subunit IIA [Nocardioidaceae bacterium]